MACFRNDTKGARAIHLRHGGYVLVEAGAVATIPRYKIRQVGPGLVEIPDPDDLPAVPAELAAKVKERTAPKAAPAPKPVAPKATPKRKAAPRRRKAPTR